MTDTASQSQVPIKARSDVVGWVSPAVEQWAVAILLSVAGFRGAYVGQWVFLGFSCCFDLLVSGPNILVPISSKLRLCDGAHTVGHMCYSLYSMHALFCVIGPSDDGGLLVDALHW